MCSVCLASVLGLHYLRDMDNSKTITGWATQAEAQAQAEYVSTEGKAVELTDGTWVALGDLSASKGRSVHHVNGLAYVGDMTQDEQLALGLLY